jgi:hypothetical protein
VRFCESSSTRRERDSLKTLVSLEKAAQRLDIGQSETNVNFVSRWRVHGANLNGHFHRDIRESTLSTFQYSQISLNLGGEANPICVSKDFDASQYEGDEPEVAMLANNLYSSVEGDVPMIPNVDICHDRVKRSNGAKQVDTRAVLERE